VAKPAEVTHNAPGMIARADLPVRLASRAELSPTCFRIELESDRAVAAAPGQFGMLACTAGLDPLLRRPFSLAGVRSRGAGSVLELLVKQIGKGTAALRLASLGSQMRLLAPLGNAYSLTPPSAGRLALVAGGIGVPPVLFAAEELARRAVPFDFFLGASQAAELLEEERCARAAAAVGGELILATDDGSRGESGFVTAALAGRIAGGALYGRILGCGPTAMLAALTLLARARGVEAELSLEQPMACGVGVCLGCVVELADGHRVPSCTQGPIFSTSALAERWWV
jgi:dihydroorotate dehydrogenase electron transfer subunit